MNDDVEARLARCFAAVFPDLRPEQVSAAHNMTVVEWDSVATLNLIALLEEEFDVPVWLDQLQPQEDAPLSFQLILNYLQRMLAAV
jgi:acyl carrier protein